MDQLRVFISSTIGECAAERVAAERAVKSVRHLPILFEALGAHPHPPRHVYLRRLMEADIFVGIYRESYGWVDPRGTISGIHDEHNVRKERQLPALLYVLRTAPARDPRLAAIIEDAKADHTIYFYESAAQLEDQIANDLTNIVTQGFEPLRFDVAPVPQTTATIGNGSSAAIQSDLLNLLRAANVSSGSDVPPIILTIEDLATLLDESMPAVLASLAAMEGLVTLRGQDTVLLDTSSFDTESARQFYVHRLAMHLEGRHRHLHAYALLTAINHPVAETLAFRAALDAVRAGEVRAALASLPRAMQFSQAQGKPDEYAVAALNFIRMLADSGEKATAHQILDNLRAQTVSDWTLAIREASLELDSIEAARPQIFNELLELRDVYHREGDEDSAARVAITLSRLAIQTDRFIEAIRETDFALRIFMRMGNRYGCATALTNMLAAQTASGQDSSTTERQLREYADHSNASRRSECFHCNIGSRRARALGDNETALRLSQRAIELAIELGDKRVELLNRINRGNALRDLNRSTEALTEYEGVSKQAASAAMTVLEADASRLAAGVHNQLTQPGRAIAYARHAVALLTTTDAREDLMRAHQEEARALELSRELDAATASYLAAAKIALETEAWESSAENLDSIVRCLGSAGAWEQLPSKVLDAFGQKAPSDYPAALMTLSERLPELLQPLPPKRSGRLALRVFELLFQNWQLRLPWQAIEPLIENTLRIHHGNGVRLVLALLSAIPTNKLRLWEWVRAAELITDAVPDLVMKPERDGAANWTVRFRGTEDVVGTIAPIDDSPTTFYVSLVCACFLASCGCSGSA